MEFLAEHWGTIMWVALLLLNLVNALSKHTKTSWMAILADVLSVVVNADSPGSVKAPLTRSKDPNGKKV